MNAYDDYYGSTSPFDEEVETFKDHLRKAVKEETQQELDKLRTENRELTGKLANLSTLERTAKETVRRYEQKLHNAEVIARRTVEKEGLRKLLELLREPRYRVTTTWDLGPKCGNCDEDRRLRYTTPRGKEAYETCECATQSKRYVVEELLVHEVAKRSGKILAWYHSTTRYYDDEVVSSPTVLTAGEGVALEEMVKNPCEYGFTTEAAAAVLADALNEAKP